MSMSTTRSLRNRSSRYSSPATFAENQAVSRPAEVQASSNGGQSSLDKWVEPTVRHAVASFEDTKGLERGGVLEHMQPLGVPPSQKLLQKLKVSLNRSSPRATPVHLEEATPPTESMKIDVASPVESEPMPELSRDEEPVTISSPPRGRPAKRELDAMKQVIDVATPSPVKSTYTFESVQASPRPQSIQDYIRQDRMKSVVDRAIIEASDQADLKIIPGLLQLWDDAKGKPQLWAVLDAILNKTPTDAQFRIFKKYIKRGVRHYRRHSSTQNNVASLSPRFLTSPQHQTITPVIPQLSPAHNDSARHVFSNSYSITSPYQLKPSTPQQTSPYRRDIVSPIAKMAVAPVEPQQQPHSQWKRTRTESLSSLSSISAISSLPEGYSPEAIETDSENPAVEGRPVRSTAQRQATNRVAVGSRTRPFVNSQSDSSQPVTELPTDPRIPPRTSKNATKKDEQLSEIERNRIIETKRREYEEDSFVGYNNIDRPQSDERTIIQGLPIANNDSSREYPPPVIHPFSLVITTSALVPPRSPQAVPEFPVLNGVGRKRGYDEIDRDDLEVMTPLSSSPAPFNVPPQPPPPVASDLPRSTRGATPRSTRFPPPNRPRKSARVIESPSKPKNGAITASVSRAGPGRDVGIGNGAETGGQENDEFCTSCSLEGTLLCCDGCPNSFHHQCLEPPLDPNEVVHGEWYCPNCSELRIMHPSPSTGLLGQMIRRMDHTNPKTYALPLDIRNYFEGVKTGNSGEYEELILPRTQNSMAKLNRSGFVDEPNYKELRDTKGNFIICIRCRKTSNGRDIIPCDYCPAKWHTDCVDPPMPVPPRRRGGDKSSGYWRCPLHVEGDLAELGNNNAAMLGDMGGVPRLRKPKNAIPVDVDLYRGFRNNGVIDVELMKEEVPDIRELVLDHGIYRLPEKGIRLDFIDRVKKSWYEDHALPRQFNKKPQIRDRLYRPDDPVLHHPAAPTFINNKELDALREITATTIAETAQANARLRHKSFKEQSAIMSLLGLSGQSQNAISIDPLADLTNVLVAEAPDDAVKEINLSEMDTLLKLQKLVNSRLAILGDQEEQKRKKLNKEVMPDSNMPNGASIPAQINGIADSRNDREGDRDGDDEMDMIS